MLGENKTKAYDSKRGSKKGTREREEKNMTEQ
jgi:hypothetical protein